MKSFLLPLLIGACMLVAPGWAWGQVPSVSTNPQILCQGSIEPYCVDCTDAQPAGTSGSTYVWEILSSPGGVLLATVTGGNPAFPGLSNHTQIDWGAYPVGNYTVRVTEINVQGCAGVPQTLAVQIIPNLTPTFAAVGPYCSGASIPALPTTSNEGITGTWSPAINNTATTTYNFTPDAGQCALPTTLTITISDLPMVTVNSSTICFGADAIITATPNPPGSYNYSWTVPSGAANPGNVNSFTATVAGDYSVIVTSTATPACSSNSATGTLTVNPQISTSPISHD